MPGTGGGPPPRWAIANPWKFGVVVGALLSAAFLLMTAIHGDLSIKTIVIAIVAALLGFVVAGLVAASYGGDVSKGW